MRAAVSTRYGSPEVVRVADVPRPEPATDQLLVRVHAATVNRTDCGFRAAHPWFIRGFTGVTRPKRTILGNEFAGTVEAVGRDVKRFSVGDRVFGYDDTRFGCHAEYFNIGQDAAVATMPIGWDFESMAPATEGSHYALAYIRAARLDHRSKVLVYGATGAIGSAAVQIIAGLGAHVTAVCNGEHRDLVADLGADRVIDRTTTDFTIDTHRYDVVFDAVGKCSFRQCRGLLEPQGTWTSTDLGPLSQNPLLALATRRSRGRRVVFPIPSIDRQMVDYLKSLVESGVFAPVVDRTYPLEDIAEAYRYVETQQKVGNVVITVGSCGQSRRYRGVGQGDRVPAGAPGRTALFEAAEGCDAPVMDLGNGVVRAILASPAHRLLSGSTDVVRYVGRRSGAEFSTPTQYARLGDDLVILVGKPETKQCWRNFRTDRDLDVLVDGEWLEMCGRAVIGADEPDVIAPLLDAYLHRFPKAERHLPGEGRDAKIARAVAVWCRPKSDS